MGRAGYRLVLIVGACAALAACGGGSSSGDRSTGDSTSAYTRTCSNFSQERQPYFGDLHVHTVYSLDANTQGTKVTPHEAYRYALGEKIGIHLDANGKPTRFTQIARPLDFAAVTDHAELFGETEICTNSAYREYNSPECHFYRQRPQESFIFFNLMAVGLPELPQFPTPKGIPLVSDAPVIGSNGKIPRLPYCGVDGQTCLEAAKTPWRDIQRAAEAFNASSTSDNCGFTTFVAYEYTLAPKSSNMHRNVIFRTEIVPELPPATQEYPQPELLWAALTEQCKTADGCDYLTIPHNSNMSDGLMFETKDRFGNDYDRGFAETRQKNEPLVEIMQAKGQSECLKNEHVNNADEFCSFEILPYNNLTGDRAGGLNTGPPKNQGDFVREALKEGLRLEQSLGANPFKYGFIGSSDTHLGTPGNTMETVDFPGHGGAGASGGTGLTDVIYGNPGGLAVLWAEQNTRDSLFSAMRRREAYATSGTRPTVRFFGGWNLPFNHCTSANYAAEGYANGVPMGSDLPARPAGAGAPRFSVSALRDPGTADDPAEPLQRIQIVKGWYEGGQKKEVVYEVAGNPANGASVDLGSCATSGPGSASLCAVWEDPDFDPNERAFYYSRVIENPSCRWSWKQCLAGGITEQTCANNPGSVPKAYADCCSNYPKTIQERAWTSPIWYTPPGP